MATTTSFKNATNFVQFAAGRIGKQFGGPLGQAYGMFLSGQGGFVSSLADALDEKDFWRP